MKLKQKFEKVFTPKILRQNLIMAALFIAVFDNFKFNITNNVKYFYFSGYENGKEQFKDYEKKVLSKVEENKNKEIRSILLWLKKNQLITQEDEDKIKEFTDIRNNFAHELTRMLYDGFPENIKEKYMEMITLFDNIERNWIIHVEMEINQPDIPYDNICFDEITSNNLEFIKIMTDVAINKNEEYLNIVKNADV